MSQDPATLDQLRVLVAIVETGSFSAAGRRLHRVQSAVSHAVAQVEGQLGAPLFDRSGKRPVLTSTGEAVLAIAREVCARADGLKRLADSLKRHEEATLSVVIDAMYPATALARTCADFAAAWPCVLLHLHTDALGAVAAQVRDGSCLLGVCGPVVDLRDLVVQHLGEIELVPVVAATHSLATVPGPVPTERLKEEVQVVLSERVIEEETPDQAVVSTRTWRVHDLQTKRALLVAGLGWGNLPLHLVSEDLAAGRLVQIQPRAWAPRQMVPLAAITRPDTALGPAGTWLLARLGQGFEPRPAATGETP